MVTTPRFVRRALPWLVALAVITAVAALAGPAAARPDSVAALAPDLVGTWPLHPTPEVAAGFDPPASEWGAGHRGVDLVGHPDQPVRSALPGTVTFAGTLAGRGVVVVQHDGTRTTYEPVSATLATGTRVGAGDRIGRLQAGPSHCTPRSCLHWGWIDDDGRYLDPLRLVGEGPVRLLPLAGLPGPESIGELPWAPPAPAYAALMDRLLPWLTPAGGPAGRPSAGGRW